MKVMIEPLIPNDETIEAMKTAKRGELVEARTPDCLLESLNATMHGRDG